MKKEEFAAKVKGTAEQTEKIKKESFPSTKPVMEKKEKTVKVENTEFKSTGLFNIGDPDVFIPARDGSRGFNKPRTNISVYLLMEEYEYLQKLSDKYGMSVSGLIRTLIANCK